MLLTNLIVIVSILFFRNPLFICHMRQWRVVQTLAGWGVVSM